MEDDLSKTGEAAPSKATPSVRKTGLSPKQQKLQAMLDKAAKGKQGGQGVHGSEGGFKAKSSFAGKKTAFQRKAT